MNKKLQIMTLSIGSLLLLSACVSKKSFNAIQAEKDELSSKLAKLEQEFATTKTDVAALQSSNASLMSDKNALNADLEKTKGDLNTQISAVKSNVDDKQRQLDELRGEINAAFADVEKAVANSKTRITEIENFLYLDLEDEVNFRSGSTKVDPNDEATLQMLVDMLKNNPTLAIIIEGHTDNKGMTSGKYQDNWELSVSRSTAVVRKLIKMGVNPEQLVASGRGEFMPTGDNTTKDGRNENRRVEAIVVPNIGKLYKLAKAK